MKAPILILAGAASLLVSGPGEGQQPARITASERANAKRVLACFDRAERAGKTGWQASVVCQRYGHPKRYSGIFIEEFEGHQFIENAMPAARYLEPHDRVWFNLEAGQGSNAERLKRNRGTTVIWYVTIVGRRSIGAGTFGHGGIFPAELLVQRVISARRLQQVDGYAGPDLLIRR